LTCNCLYNTLFPLALRFKAHHVFLQFEQWGNGAHRERDTVHREETHENVENETVHSP
jgi:hypothetical protein